MNYAFFRILGKMVGENFVRLYGSSIISLDEGKALAGIIEKADADNFETDIKLVNEWVLFLDMANWFKWVPFEATPYNY
jgi:bifunctional N-acetylglucosamine-1-phosphate-uridyltransferase/glucosamine-1-phosphate-acetyltransferase GlmU-like protein